MLMFWMVPTVTWEDNKKVSRSHLNQQRFGILWMEGLIASWTFGLFESGPQSQQPTWVVCSASWHVGPWLYSWCWTVGEEGGFRWYYISTIYFIVFIYLFIYFVSLGPWILTCGPVSWYSGDWSADLMVITLDRSCPPKGSYQYLGSSALNSNPFFCFS